MRIESNGQITIRQRIRERVSRLLQKSAADDTARGRRAVESLRGRGTLRMSTDEVMALTRGDEDDSAQE